MDDFDRVARTHYKNLAVNGTITIVPSVIKVMLSAFSKSGVPQQIAQQIISKMSSNREWNEKFKDMIFKHFMTYVTDDYVHAETFENVLIREYVKAWVFALNEESKNMFPHQMPQQQQAVFVQQMPGTVPVQLSNGQVGYVYPQQLQQQTIGAMGMPQQFVTGNPYMSQYQQPPQAATVFGMPPQASQPQHTLPQQQAPQPQQTQQQTTRQTENTQKPVSAIQLPLSLSDLKVPFEKKGASDVKIGDDEPIAAISVELTVPVNSVYDIVQILARSWSGYHRRKWIIAVKFDELQYLSGLQTDRAAAIFNESRESLERAGRSEVSMESVLDGIGRKETNHTYAIFEQMIVTAVERHIRSQIRSADSRQMAVTGIRNMREILDLYRIDTPFKKLGKDFLTALDYAHVAGTIDVFMNSSVVTGDSVYPHALMCNGIDLVRVTETSSLIGKHQVSRDEIEGAVEYIKEHGTILKSNKTVLVTNVMDDTLTPACVEQIKRDVQQVGGAFQTLIDMLKIKTDGPLRAAGSEVSMATVCYPIGQRDKLFICNEYNPFM